MVKLLLAALLSTAAWGQTNALRLPYPAPEHRSWLYSTAALLLASQVADTVTTVQDSHNPALYEANPLGVRGALAFKWSTTSVLLAGEYLFRGHPRERRWFSLVNVGLSLEFGWAAAHNVAIGP